MTKNITVYRVNQLYLSNLSIQALITDYIIVLSQLFNRSKKNNYVILKIALASGSYRLTT